MSNGSKRNFRRALLVSVLPPPMMVVGIVGGLVTENPAWFLLVGVPLVLQQQLADRFLENVEGLTKFEREVLGPVGRKYIEHYAASRRLASVVAAWTWANVAFVVAFVAFLFIHAVVQFLGLI